MENIITLNPQLLTPDKIAKLKELGVQEQDDKIIIECLYNIQTQQEYYIFQLDVQTQLAECYTNEDFSNVEIINLKEMEDNPSIRLRYNFTTNLTSEIVASKLLINKNEK